MAPRRWIRVDVGWSDSEWVGNLEPGGRLAWIELLAYAKRDGAGGSVKALTAAAFGRKIRVPAADVQAMLDEAAKDGALVIADGTWTLTNWTEYQEPDRTAAERQRRHRADKSRLSPLRRDNRDTPLQPVTGGVTRRVTETETETERNTEHPPPASTRAHASGDDGGQAVAVAEMLTDLSVEITNLDDRLRPRMRAAAKSVIDGEDRTAWLDPRTKGAAPIPWPDRPTLFRLALADCLSEGECTQRALSGKVKYHALKQLDPYEARTNAGSNGNGAHGGRAATARAPAAPGPGANLNRRRGWDDPDPDELDNAG